MDITDTQLSVLTDMLDEFADKLRHYPDAEMSWNSDEVTAFNDLHQMVTDTAKARGIY